MKFFDVPEGYIPGLSRCGGAATQRTHLYKGDFADPGLPMCRHGWNRDGGESYSIWRNNVGPKGICQTCLKRARAGLEGVESKFSEDEVVDEETGDS